MSQYNNSESAENFASAGKKAVKKGAESALKLASSHPVKSGKKALDKAKKAVETIKKLVADPIMLSFSGGMVLFFLILLCFLCMPLAWLGVGDSAESEDALATAYTVLMRDVRATFEDDYQSMTELGYTWLDKYIEQDYPSSQNDTRDVNREVYGINYGTSETENAIASYYLAKKAVIDEFYRTGETDDIDLWEAWGGFDFNVSTAVALDQMKHLFGNAVYSKDNFDDSRMYRKDHDVTIQYETTIDNPNTAESGEVTMTSTYENADVWDGTARLGIEVIYSTSFMEDEYNEALASKMAEYPNMSAAEAKQELDNEILDMQENILVTIKELGTGINSLKGSHVTTKMWNNGEYAFLSWQTTNGNGEYSWSWVHSIIHDNGLSGLADGWCTDFVHARFYSFYGIDCADCDGARQARQTVEMYPDKFFYTTDISEVTAGTIVSYGNPDGGSWGHVGFIEDITKDGMVIVSDGNIDPPAGRQNYGGIRLNRQLDSLTAFIEDANNYVSFCVPREEYIKQLGLLESDDFTNTDSMLIVANKKHKLPEGYEPTDLTIPNVESIQTGLYLREEAAEQLEKMFEAAKADGITLVLGSAYRSQYAQDVLWKSYSVRYGIAEADRISARAGYSDHQTGLAVDISDADGSTYLTEEFENTAEGIWLRTHAHEYGFIMRYPKGKEEITGYAYEPWHFRYVGVQNASEIYAEGEWTTFEEHFAIEGGDYE